MKKNSSFKNLLFATCLLGLIAVIGLLFFGDSKKPEINLAQELNSFISPQEEIALTVSDLQSGIKSIKIDVIRGNQSFNILSETYNQKPTEQKINFTLEKAKLPDGEFTLNIKVNDASYASFGTGNETSLVYNLKMDTQAPKITVITPAPNIRRGGAALIVFSSSEELKTSGVRFGDYFFKAYPLENGSFACLFPFPYFLDTSNYSPEIMAQDLAGNITSSRLLVNLTGRVFPEDTVKINDNFLQTKEEELRRILPSTDDTLELYKKVNNEVRIANDALILSMGNQTAPYFTWTKNFQRQPKSASRANFGDSRTYTYNNEKIDYQVHTGIDLASIQQDIVRASNTGTVIFADYLGIYGNTVILDHGRGLQTLYSHLTDIHVKVNDNVEQNHDLGTTGTTGLAVGDHVHFAFLIGGIPVQPAEWFDAAWVKNNITTRIKGQ